jgi:hypothetical protein
LSKEFHGLPVDQNDILQIDGNCILFLPDYVAKCFQILVCNSAADAQHHDVVTADGPIDAAAHSDIDGEVSALPLICAFLRGFYGGAPWIKQALSRSQLIENVWLRQTWFSAMRREFRDVREFREFRESELEDLQGSTFTGI